MKNGINLIPDDVVRARLAKKVRVGLIAFAVVYTVFLAVVFAFQRLDIRDKREALEQIEARQKEIFSSGSRPAELAVKLADTKRVETELTQKINAASGFSGKKIAWAYVLKRLSADIPEGVWLRGIATSESDSALKRVRLTGSSTSNSLVADFISALENSGMYKDLSLTYTQKRELAGGGSVYDFELHMDLKRTEMTVHDW